MLIRKHYKTKYFNKLHFFVLDFALTIYIVTVILSKNAALYGIAGFHLLKMELLYWHQTDVPKYGYFPVICTKS